MRRAFGLGRKSISVEDNVKPKKPDSLVHLNGAKKDIRRVLFLRENELLLAACQDGVVRIYDIGSTGTPRDTFEEHSVQVNGLIRLKDDLVASVGDDNQLLTWHAADGIIVDSWRHIGCLLRSMAKLSSSRIAVGDNCGELIVLSHDRGRQLHDVKHVENAHSDWIRDIVVHQNLMVTCSSDKTAKIWDTTSLEVVATLKHTSSVYSAGINEKKVITVCGNGKMTVHRNQPGFPLEFVLRTGNQLNFLTSISILNDDVVAIAGNSRSLGFISLSSKSFVSRTELNTNWVNSFAVMSDGRIAAGGADGYCSVFRPCEGVQTAVETRVSALYRSPTFDVVNVQPIRVAWVSVQKGELSLLEACNSAIEVENCARSVDELCMAHHLLMTAVESGDIPASRDYNGVDAYWYTMVYEPCVNLPLGEKDVMFVLSLFQEAECCNVLAVGTTKILMGIIGKRNDIDKEMRFAVQAVFHLLMRQIRKDTRLEKAFGFEDVSKFMTLVYALLACFQDCNPRAIATNVISGGASVLENIHMCGLVESLLDEDEFEETGLDPSGLSDFQISGVVESLMTLENDTPGFENGIMVVRFLRRANEVLSDYWSDLPTLRRQKVKKAVKNLGFSVQEIREILLSLSAHESGVRRSTKPRRVPVPDAKESPRQGIAIEERTSDASIEPERTDGPEIQLIAVVPQGPNGGKIGSDKFLDEMNKWESTTLSKEAVEKLKTGEVASALASFLVNYEAERVQSFVELRSALNKHFYTAYIFGSSFTMADENEKYEVIQVALNAIGEVTDGKALDFLAMRLKQFVKVLR